MRNRLTSEKTPCGNTEGPGVGSLGPGTHTLLFLFPPLTSRLLTERSSLSPRARPLSCHLVAPSALCTPWRLGRHSHRGTPWAGDPRAIPGPGSHGAAGGPQTHPTHTCPLPPPRQPGLGLLPSSSLFPSPLPCPALQGLGLSPSGLLPPSLSLLFLLLLLPREHSGTTTQSQCRFGL